MKFIRYVSEKPLTVPVAAAKISGIGQKSPAEIHVLDNAVVILEKRMTAVQLVRAIDALHQLAIELTVHLAEACGFCDECSTVCPFAGCAHDTPKQAAPTRGHTLQEVPTDLLELLDGVGICRGALARHLVEDDIVYE